MSNMSIMSNNWPRLEIVERIDDFVWRQEWSIMDHFSGGIGGVDRGAGNRGESGRGIDDF